MTLKLPQQPDAYSRNHLAEMTRQIELAYNALEQMVLQIQGGSGTVTGLSNANPQPLGTAAPGSSTLASRGDHVHAMPDAEDVGADPEGAADAAIAAHVAEANPHPQYLTSADIFVSSISEVPEDETVTVPAAYNLLITNRGLKVYGSLNVYGQVFAVDPNV